MGPPMSPPVTEVRRSNGQKVSRLRVPTVTGYSSRGPVSIDDQNWRQTLKLNILLDQMNVQNAPRQFAGGRFRLGQIQDSNGRRSANRRWFLVRDWRPQEWNSFVADFERVTEQFWSGKFMLVPPAGYDGLNWPRSHPTHRPNVITHLDANIRPRTNMALYPYVNGWRPVAVWKLATRMDLPGSGVRLPGSMQASARDIGLRDFRSSASTMIRADAYANGGRTAIHEAGHLTGQRHPGQWRHVNAPGCRDDDGAPACYAGTRPEHAANIMGSGTGILPENADPWRSFMAEHTGTTESDWHVFLMNSGGALPTPVALAQQTATRQPARPAPTRARPPATP